MSNLDFALGEARSWCDWKRSAVSVRAPSPVAETGSTYGMPFMSSDAIEQGKHFVGWQYVAIKAIAQRAAAQPLKLGFIRKAPEPMEMSGSHRPGRRRHEMAKAVLLRGMLPAYLRCKARDMEVVESHPLIDTFNDPNEIMTGWSLVYTTLCSLNLTGKAFWWFVKENGRLNIWPLPAAWVSPQHGNGLFSSYVITPPNTTMSVIVPASQMAYFPLPDPSNPLCVISPLTANARAVSTDEQIQEAQFRAFKNGIFPGMKITVGRLEGMDGRPGERPVLTPVQRRQIVALAKQFYKGARNFDEPLVVDGMIEDVSRVTNSPQEMAFLESGQMTKSRLFQAFNVNPIMVGEIVSTNRAQAAVAEEHFCSMAVNPLLNLMGQVITQWLGDLLTSTDRNRVVAFFEPCRAHDPEQTLKEWQLGLTAKAVTRDEYRMHVMHMPPLTDEDKEDILSVTPPPPVPPGGPPKEDEEEEPPKEDEEEEEKKEKAYIGLTDQRSSISSSGLKGVLPPDERRSKYLRQHGELELAFANDLQVLFEAQVKSAVKEMLKIAPKSFDKKSLGDTIIGLAFQPRAWDKQLLSIVEEHLTEAAFEAANTEWQIAMQVLREAQKTVTASDVPEGIQLPKNVEDAIIGELNKAMAAPWWPGINDTQKDIMRDAIDRGIKQNMSVRDIAADILSGVDGMTKARAEGIARTETTGAMNAGHQEVMKTLFEAGIVEGKQWLAVMDQKVRLTHSFINGVIVEPNGTFDVGGFPARYPGAYELPPSQRNYCRCTVVSAFVKNLEGALERLESQTGG